MLKNALRKENARIIIYLIVAGFMAVTVGHVSDFAGSMELPGREWLGLPYAIAVDLSILACAWLTTWATTSRWAWVGYVAFTLASGAMNVAHVKPWARGTDALGAWVYAVFPTAAQAGLGFLARDAGRFRKKKEKSEIEARLSTALKEARADVSRLEQELARGRPLGAIDRKAFATFRASYNGNSDGLSAGAWNVELARAGFEPVRERVLLKWLKEGKD